MVITGCAHPGIVRIVEIAQKILPENDLALVMGGFHLLNDGNEEILSIIKRFQSRVSVMQPLHTVARGQETFRPQIREEVHPPWSGIIGLEDLK